MFSSVSQFWLEVVTEEDTPEQSLKLTLLGEIKTPDGGGFPDIVEGKVVGMALPELDFLAE